MFLWCQLEHWVRKCNWGNLVLIIWKVWFTFFLFSKMIIILIHTFFFKQNIYTALCLNIHWRNNFKHEYLIILTLQLQLKDFPHFTVKLFAEHPRRPNPNLRTGRTNNNSPTFRVPRSPYMSHKAVQSRGILIALFALLIHSLMRSLN